MGRERVTRIPDTRGVSEATVDVAGLRRHGAAGLGRRGAAGPGDRSVDGPLREDIRLPGRVPGQVVGDQAGADVLDPVSPARSIRDLQPTVDGVATALRTSG